MRFLSEYITGFEDSTDPAKEQLGKELKATKMKYDLFLGGNPLNNFTDFVDRYNWLGQPENKKKYDITQNLARNLPGALMQDYLISLMISLLRDYDSLDVFTEVRVPFGIYPLWSKGDVKYESPSERSDITVGYMVKDGKVVEVEEQWPRPLITSLPPETSVVPLITINSKIRISQSEFFDWLGREQLMTKGNPHCLSIQVALRKEMDINIVEVAQAGDKFFLLGSGGEGNVNPETKELHRLINHLKDHLNDHMLD